MRLLSNQEYHDLMIEISKPMFHNGPVMGITWETYKDYIAEVCYIEVDHSEFLKVAAKHAVALEGVHMVVTCGTQARAIARKHGLPEMAHMAAAVIPNQLGIDLMMVDHVYFNRFTSEGEMILAHELVHVHQSRRGDLEFVEGGSIKWNGWSQTALTLEEHNESFVGHKSDMDIISNEILTKPWECEAYALTTPVARWTELFSEEAIQYIMANLDKFRISHVVA